jgi:FkbM family methyltransferase
MRKILYRTFRFVSKFFAKLAEYIQFKKSKLIRVGEYRNLYKLPSKKLMLLNKSGYIDNQIIQRGVFEPKSTALVNQFVKEGDVVIDVGANIGYYTIMCSELVGHSGHVYAFEPTQHFGKVLKENLSLNNVANVSVFDYGLSNVATSVTIDIGPSSATLHSPQGYDEVVNNEQIRLIPFNDFIKDNNLNRVDFIKIDVDGHEPYFFEGAWDVLDLFNVVILFEISHLHYLEAGIFAWDFYEDIVGRGYNIFHENGLKKINTRNEFLRNCADFSSSCNIIITKRKELV